MNFLGNLSDHIGPSGQFYSFLYGSKFFDNLEA
jgi:hypothetical protein